MIRIGHFTPFYANIRFQTHFEYARIERNHLNTLVRVPLEVEIRYFHVNVIKIVRTLLKKLKNR